eukprot:6199576-Pleurochrysis_carterae.AAC.3
MEVSHIHHQTRGSGTSCRRHNENRTRAIPKRQSLGEASQAGCLVRTQAGRGGVEASMVLAARVFGGVRLCARQG